MKRNAIMRIIVWTVVLVVLLAVLFIGTFGMGRNRLQRDVTPVETEVAIPQVTSPIDTASCNAIATKTLNIRNAPHPDAEIVAICPKGTVLNILRQETIGGKQWGYLGSSAFGWVEMEYVDPVEALMPAEEDSDNASVTIPQTAGQGDALTVVVTANAVNVRMTPSTGSRSVGSVEKGDVLQIVRVDTVDGLQWGCISEPVSGWVVMKYVEPVEQTTAAPLLPETSSQPLQANAVSLDAGNIRDIEIEWAAGTIVIQPKDIAEIYVMEDGLTGDQEPMVWNVRDNKLAIQYSKKMDHEFGMGLLFGEESKDLIIQVPFSWQCDSLEIDAASASLEVHDLTIREMEFDGASGTCVFDNCTVEQLDVDTASGDVLFTGSLEEMDCDGASANINLDLTNVPRRLDLDTASGDLEMALPAYAGFTVTMDTMSGEFESDFDAVLRGDSYVWGDGSCRIDVDAMSGDVRIHKGK